MNTENSIKLFEDKSVRTMWNDKEEKWYFSVVDIIAILTDNTIKSAKELAVVGDKQLSDPEIMEGKNQSED